MNKYSNGFYTLMEEAGILSSKSFTAYIRDVVGFGNIQDLNLDGFSWDPISSLTFDYEQLSASNRLKVMATYADKDSEAIPFGTEGFKMTEGVIPRQKARFLWDEDDYRKYLDAVNKLVFHFNLNSHLTFREVSGTVADEIHNVIAELGLDYLSRENPERHSKDIFYLKLSAEQGYEKAMRELERFVKCFLNLYRSLFKFRLLKNRFRDLQKVRCQRTGP